MQQEQLAEPLVNYPLARQSIIDPAPMLARLREAGPIQQVRIAGGGPAWLVTRYADVRVVLSHPAFGTQYPGVIPTADENNLAAGFMFLKDPPEHTRLRRSVSRAFTARRIEQLRERAQSVADDLVAAMLAKGGVVDVQEDFAYPLPIAIISELLSIPPTDRGRFRHWADVVLRAVGAPAEVGAAFMDLQRFVVELVRTKPDGDDLLSDLARRSGEQDGLTTLELSSMAMGLLMAGYITTAAAISHGLLRLFEHQPVLRGVRTGELEIDRVVEELLRLQDEEIGIQRIAQSDVEVCGVRIAKGETVIASRVSANRDPLEFADADAMQPTAERSPHLAFGHGIHHCLGAALARMELAVALGTLLRRIPDIQLAGPPHSVEWRAEGMDVSIERLPVTW